MNPYEPGDELDRVDPTLDEVARRVESYARRSGGEPPADLVSRITAVLADEPIPVGRWAWLGPWREPLRAVAAVVVLAAIIGGALLAGTLIDRARNVGSSPTPAVPSVSASPSIPPTPTPTVSPSSLVTPQPTISVTPLPTVSPVTVPVTRRRRRRDRDSHAESDGPRQLRAGRRGRKWQQRQRERQW